jgi:hypothetical protein
VFGGQDCVTKSRMLMAKFSPVQTHFLSSFGHAPFGARFDMVSKQVLCARHQLVEGDHYREIKHDPYITV